MTGGRGGMLCLGEVVGLVVVRWWVGNGRWGRGPREFQAELRGQG